MFVDVRYEDPANDVLVEDTLHLTQGDPATLRRRPARPHADGHRVHGDLHLHGRPSKQLPPSVTYERRIIVNPDMHGHRVVEVRPPADWAARSVRRSRWSCGSRTSSRTSATPPGSSSTGPRLGPVRVRLRRRRAQPLRVALDRAVRERPQARRLDRVRPAPVMPAPADLIPPVVAGSGPPPPTEDPHAQPRPTDHRRRAHRLPRPCRPEPLLVPPRDGVARPSLRTASPLSPSWSSGPPTTAACARAAAS